MSNETSREEAVAEDGMPVFQRTGAAVSGEHHCSNCGYGIMIPRILPRCAMCAGTAWEPISSSPFGRARS